MFKRLSLLRPLRAYSTSPLGKDSTIESNIISESNRLSKTLEKFWDKIDIKQNDSNLLLTIDSKPIRTPLGNDLTIPQTRGILAHLIKHEWNNLDSFNKIKPYSLPLTSLTSRVIDLSKNEDVNDQINSKGDIINQLLRYLDTDTLLVFSPLDEYEGALRKDQELRYKPIIKQIEDKLNVSLTYLDSDRDGLRGNKQTPETHEKVSNWLHSLDHWELVALEKTTLTTKSLICGILIVSPDQHNFTIEDIAQLATLEIIHQTEKWGEVEDTHDVDYQDVRRNLHSASILVFEEKP